MQCLSRCVCLRYTRRLRPHLSLLSLSASACVARLVCRQRIWAPLQAPMGCFAHLPRDRLLDRRCGCSSSSAAGRCGRGPETSPTSGPSLETLALHFQQVPVVTPPGNISVVPQEQTCRAGRKTSGAHALRRVPALRTTTHAFESHPTDIPKLMPMAGGGGAIFPSHARGHLGEAFAPWGPCSCKDTLFAPLRHEHPCCSTMLSAWLTDKPKNNFSLSDRGLRSMHKAQTHDASGGEEAGVKRQLASFDALCLVHESTPSRRALQIPPFLVIIAPKIAFEQPEGHSWHGCLQRSEQSSQRDAAELILESQVSQAAQIHRQGPKARRTGWSRGASKEANYPSKRYCMKIHKLCPTLPGVLL